MNYHYRIMDMPVATAYSILNAYKSMEAYKAYWRGVDDTTKSAAEIANEADTEILRLKTALMLIVNLCHIDAPASCDSPTESVLRQCGEFAQETLDIAAISTPAQYPARDAAGDEC